MIGRMVTAAAVFAAGVSAGRVHQRGCAFGTSYWRAQCELALALYDEDRLRSIHSRIPQRGAVRIQIERFVAATGRALIPTPSKRTGRRMQRRPASCC